MACGKLVKILLHSKVTRYLEFKSVDGSYVFKDGKVNKIPATPAEALTSPLMGFFEKRKYRNFLMFVLAYDKDKPDTYFLGKNCFRFVVVFVLILFVVDVVVDVVCVIDINIIIITIIIIIIITVVVIIIFIAISLIITTRSEEHTSELQSL